MKTLSVLYVEDEEEVRELLSRFLMRWVGVLHTAANGQEGIRAFAEYNPDVVVTDIKMPVMDGLEMASSIKSSTREEVPIIVITAHSEQDYFIRAIEIGVDRYVIKPVNTDTLLGAIYKSAKASAQTRELERARQTVVETLEQTIAVVSRAIESRDPYTDGHQKRVSLLAVAIAEEMGMAPDVINGIRLGSLIHDVGKIRIPAEILTNPRKLSSVEMDIIRTHSQAGHDILAGAEFPWPVARMVLEHHERMDGSGYPNGLAGEHICLEARIICIADVVESMASFRPYRPALGIEQAVEEIRTNRGSLYDENVVDACIKVLEKSDYKFWD
ncbi:MAG TPA: HD domain-containing phosphohydrolase [Sulfuricella sp.]|nr:HD domain-containing phosphohydrolase [Sulfuricella sp.]